MFERSREQPGFDQKYAADWICSRIVSLEEEDMPEKLIQFSSGHSLEEVRALAAFYRFVGRMLEAVSDQAGNYDA